MNLSDFMAILKTQLDSKVEKNPITNRRTDGERLKTFLGAFTYTSGETTPLDDLQLDYLGKVFNGRDRLAPDKVSFFLERIDDDAFVDFCSDLSTDAKNMMINAFASFHETISYNNFEKDVSNLLKSILYNLVNYSRTQSIKYAEFIGNNKVKIGGKTLNLPPELSEDTSFSSDENKYIDALLEVYSEDSGIQVNTTDDLKTLTPKYVKHLTKQKSYFFSAENVLHQIRDIFSDGEYEFNKLKNETFEGIDPFLDTEFINSLDKVKKTIVHVTMINYSRSYLGRQNNGLIGPNEKCGIVHMLVNDGKVRWFDDENI